MVGVAAHLPHRQVAKAAVVIRPSSGMGIAQYQDPMETLIVRRRLAEEAIGGPGRFSVQRGSDRALRACNR